MQMYARAGSSNVLGKLLSRERGSVFRVAMRRLSPPLRFVIRPADKILPLLTLLPLERRSSRKKFGEGSRSMDPRKRGSRLFSVSAFGKDARKKREKDRERVDFDGNNVERILKFHG